MWPMEAVYVSAYVPYCFLLVVCFCELLYRLLHMRYIFYALKSLSIFNLFYQPKDSKKEKETDRGSKVSSYTKVSITLCLELC